MHVPEKLTESSRLLDLIWTLLLESFDLRRKNMLPDLSFSFLYAAAKSEGLVITQRHLSRLVDSGYLSYNHHTDEIRLLRKGIRRLVVKCAKQTHKFSKFVSELCIVSFDIPETYRRRREDFRGFLKDAKFKQVHKSTWTNDLDLCLHAKYAARLFDVERFVVVYRGRLV